MDDKKIFVFYVGVANMESAEVAKYMEVVKSRFLTDEFLNNLGGELIVLPVRQVDSRFECINPKYITDQELLKEHRLRMDHLHDNFKDYISQNTKKEE